MPDVHPTAVVSRQARLGEGVVIGPYCVVDGEVALGDRTRLMSHVVVTGRTTLGEDCVLYPFASIGHPPQDLKYRGEPSTLDVGPRCRIRENVTMNPGTQGGGMATRVGADCLFMAGAHVAHDCQIGDHVIFANQAVAAGHVVVGAHAILGGLSAVHQFCRIGRNAMIGGMSGVEADVIPFGSVVGNRAHLAGLNIVGMKRCGLPRDEIHAMRGAYRELFETEAGALRERMMRVAEIYGESETVRELVSFLQVESSRALCLPKSARGA